MEPSEGAGDSGNSVETAKQPQEVNMVCLSHGEGRDCGGH